MEDIPMQQDNMINANTSLLLPVLVSDQNVRIIPPVYEMSLNQIRRVVSTFHFYSQMVNKGT